MSKTKLINDEKPLVAIARVTHQTGFYSSDYFNYIQPITKETTVGELIGWVNSHEHCLNLISLTIQEAD